jgi:hypothetical protein
LPRCPNCGTEANRIRKEWNYSIFHVESFKCEKCGNAFLAYYYQNKFSHIISISNKGPKIKTRIIGYLKNHDFVREEEIANSLHINAIDVLKVLAQLEKKGVVSRFVALEE